MSEVLTENDFTPNEVLQSIQPGDSSVDIIGIVIGTRKSRDTAEKQYLKFLISNNDGSRVQVIAWESNRDLLKSIKEMHSIVHIGNVRAITPKVPMWNQGNVPYELQLKENSTVKVYSLMKNHIEKGIKECTIEEAYKNLKSTIKVDGVIKTAPKKHSNRSYTSIVGSITDCSNKLEFKLEFDNQKFIAMLEKGVTVEMTGEMEQYPPGPPYLRVDVPEQIRIINAEKVSFIDVFNGYKTPIEATNG